jgi:hypothetical protein
VTRRSTIIAQGSYEYKFEVPFFPLHVVKFNPNFGLHESSMSEGRKYGGRKDNDHLAQDEVRLLVHSVYEYRVGKWKLTSEEKIFLDVNSNTSSLEGAYTSVTLLLVLVIHCTM